MKILKKTVVGVVASLLMAGGVMGYSTDQEQVPINWEINHTASVALESQLFGVNPINLVVSDFQGVDGNVVWGQNVVDDQVQAESNAPYDISVIAHGHLAEGLRFLVANYGTPNLEPDGTEQAYGDFIAGASNVIEWGQDASSLGSEHPYASQGFSNLNIARRIVYALIANESAASTYETGGGLTLTWTIAPQN